MGTVGSDGGSFRDPSGQVHLVDGRVYRTVMPRAMEDFGFVRDTGLIDELVADGQLVPETRADPGVLGESGKGATLVLEHPRLPFISYPYEWSFTTLKTAALLHLDVHLRALEHGVTLSDATAYNIQFDRGRALFIDSLSFRRYRDGEFWLGHRQFCEQFLNPLLLRSLFGIPHNAWYRGGLEGISAQQLNPLLRWRHLLSWNVLVHVVMQARFQSRATAAAEAEKKINTRKLSLAAFQHMLRGLRKWIAVLEPADTSPTVWSTYTADNSYESEEAHAKARFVTEFAGTLKPKMLWDIGCNTGDYARTALEAGAETVIGFDFDQGALDLAFARAKTERLNFLPLFMDAANQSPSQGWAQGERLGLTQRGEADGLLALALVHHLAIGRNIPLQAVVDWLVEMAPNGVVEFVQKSDPMVQTLLRLRDDIFDDYSEENFVKQLESRADIVQSETVSSTGRRLFWFQRH